VLVVPTTPAETLRWFSQQWDDTIWTAARNSMRPADDKGWQVRMLALQSLVKSDTVAIPVLLKALKGENVAVRILAAQALSFLSPQVPRQAIADAAKNDSNATVRLYAADTLGMQGNMDSAQLLKQLHEDETNRDVRWHLRYALERGSHAVSKTMVQKLRAWDPARLASATIGKSAPNFKLRFRCVFIQKSATVQLHLSLISREHYNTCNAEVILVIDLASPILLLN
jgi:HEAT repeat protein